MATTDSKTTQNTEKETKTKVTSEKLALAVIAAVDKKFSVTLETKEQRPAKKLPMQLKKY